MALMHRALNFRQRMLPDGGSAVLGAGVTIGLATAGDGAVSLAIGLVVAAVLQPIFGYVVGVRVRPIWDRSAAGEAVHWIGIVGAGGSRGQRAGQCRLSRDLPCARTRTRRGCTHWPSGSRGCPTCWVLS